MIRSESFGFPRVFGFGDGRHSRGRYPIEYFYSRGMQHSLFGLSTGYNVYTLQTSDSVVGLGNVKWFADNGTLYAQDDLGNILKEATPGVGDFAIDHTTALSNGAGLVGDAKGRIVAFRNASIDLNTAGVWADAWQTGIFNWQHPADTYEGMTIFGNGPQVGLIDSADVMNTTAFTLPSSMRVDCLKSGKHGILIGANLGYRGALILWDAGADRSITPWIWTNGKVQSIERTDTGWIVVTQKEILITNGYTTRSLFPLLDDPLAFNQYIVAPQGTLGINNKLFLLNQSGNHGRMRPGLYIFDLATPPFEYVPMSTGNMESVAPLALYSAKTGTQEIVIGFMDSALSKNYIAGFNVTGGTSAVLIPQMFGGGPTTKAAEALIVSLGVPVSTATKQTFTFTLAAKIYDFKRPLWGQNSTNATSGATNQLRIDGTSTSLTKGVIGDEVTILEGSNAGKVAHITAIANAAASNETWTLDTSLPNLTGSGTHLSVQPFQLIEKKTFPADTELGNFYFNIENTPTGKQFLTKLLFEGMTNVQIELHSGEFVSNDLGIQS